MPIYIDPNTFQAYDYDPVTQRATPVGTGSAAPTSAMPNYGTRGYAGVQGLPGSPSGLAVRAPYGATYTDPTTLATFTATPGSTAITASGPGYGTNAVVPATLPTTTSSTAQGPAGPVDRHDTVAAQARVYRINHGLATADDSAVTDALNAESLAAERAGRTYLNRDLAAQYGQTPAAGTVGPRTDVVNALQMPPTTAPTTMLAQSPYTRQPIVLAPTTTTSVYSPAATQQGNNLLAQGIY